MKRRLPWSRSLLSVTRTRSPLQKELGSLTYVLGIIAWGAVAFIVIVGLARGEKFSDVLLLGTAMAISATLHKTTMWRLLNRSDRYPANPENSTKGSAKSRSASRCSSGSVPRASISSNSRRLRDNTWLAALDRRILDRVVALAPEVLFEGGDPAKLAKALITLAGSDEPPVRWPAGADAVETFVKQVPALPKPAVELPKVDLPSAGEITSATFDFAGFFDWMVASRGFAEREWRDAGEPWVPPSSFTLAAGERHNRGCRDRRTAHQKQAARIHSRGA